MLSQKPWKPDAVLILIGAVFFCLLGGGLISGLLYSKATVAQHGSFGTMLISMLSFQGAALVLIFCFVKFHRTTFRETFGFANRWPRTLLIGFIAVPIFLPVALALQQLSAAVMVHFSRTPQAQEVVEALRTVHSLPEQITMFLLAVIVVPVAEELLFRGILYPVIKQAGYPRLALWGVSAFFAATHLTLVIFLSLFALALLLTILYERTNNLLCPIAMHCAFNGFNFVLLYVIKDAA